MTETTKTDEDETTEDPYEGLDEVQRELMERQGTKLTEPDAEEEAGEGEGEEDAVEEVAAVAEPDHLFELDDGTKITLAEAKAGYLRHADYTRKTQTTAEERKQLSDVGAIVEYFRNDQGALDRWLNEVRNGGPQQQVQQDTTKALTKMEVPENYKGDQFVEQTITVLNELRDTNIELAHRLGRIEGQADTAEQSKEQEKKDTESKAQLESRLQEGYKHLGDKVEQAPTPQEFMKRFNDYLVEQKLDPQVVGPYIIGPDSGYIRTLVDRAFQADISEANKEKVNSVETNRRKRTAKGVDLRVAGKTAEAMPRKLPKDSKAALMQIQAEQQKLVGR